MVTLRPMVKKIRSWSKVVALRPLDKKIRKLEMASNLRVVVDISSSRRSVQLAFIGGLVLGCWKAYLSFVFATDTPELC